VLAQIQSPTSVSSFDLSWTLLSVYGNLCLCLILMLVSTFLYFVTVLHRCKGEYNLSCVHSHMHMQERRPCTYEFTRRSYLADQASDYQWGGCGHRSRITWFPWSCTIWRVPQAGLYWKGIVFYYVILLFIVIVYARNY